MVLLGAGAKQRFHSDGGAEVMREHIGTALAVLWFVFIAVLLSFPLWHRPKKNTCRIVTESKGNWPGATWVGGGRDTMQRTKHLIHNRTVKVCPDGTEEVVREWDTVLEF